MRYITITEYGQHLGIEGERVQVREGNNVLLEAPLSRVRAINIAKAGVSLSSNLMLALAMRGIRLFVLDWRGIAVAALSGTHRHAVAAVREAQFALRTTSKAAELSARFIHGKIRNQRAVLLYFAKYLKRSEPEQATAILATADKLADLAARVAQTRWAHHDQWREEIMGIEGAAARAYWQTLSASPLLPDSFLNRQGRGASELTNQMLNYGYTLLTSHCWSALDNAGLELYAGFLHQSRPGKPALVLDFMEEYRPWVVDRAVITLRHHADKADRFTPALKRKLADHIHGTLQSRLPYRKKRLRLDTIMQRQAYRLTADIMTEKRYKPYLFRW